MARIDRVVEEVGLSHKQFIQRFRSRVGLGPKRFCRILRFRDVLERVHRKESVAWADLAAACGYFDQAHFIAEFGISPGSTPAGTCGIAVRTSVSCRFPARGEVNFFQ